MSELNIKVRKSQDNGSTFRATPDTLYMGGVGSAKVDTLHFEVPEEWAGCAITLHVQRLSGALPDPQMLDENNCVVVDRRWTQEKQGSWMLLAVDENGYIAMTKPGQYTCYETIDTNSTTETITPSVYEQFVAAVEKWGQTAVDAAAKAKGSEENAADSASASADFAAAAARSKSAAEWRATKAADSASAAEKSKTAAATSESNAAKHEEAAKKAAEEDGAKAGTDKTLSIENAPADAKATGDALAGKLGLHDMADNAENWSGYSIRQEHNTSDTWIPVFSDDNVDYVLKSEIADLNGIATSGSGYTRFTDGTQICWGTAIVNGQVSETNVKVSYPLAFADTPSIVAGSNWNIGNTPVCIGWENSTSFSIGLGQPGTGISRWLAIGRWK